MPQYKKIHDVTIAMYEGMPIWPGNPEFEHTLFKSMKEGASSDISVVKMGTHTGTHVDAPAHFISGASTVDELPLDILVGEAIVFELDVEEKIKRSDLEAIDFSNYIRVLFKTKNSTLWDKNEFVPNFVFFEADAARYLVEKGIKLVGIDYLSVGEYKKGSEVHRILLGSGIIAVEGLDLSGIEPRSYDLMCLPLKVLGAEGAPARVFLGEA